MNQNIRYKGLALTPDELAAESGTLAISANAEIHDGAIRPSMVVGTEVENALQVVRNDVAKTVNGVTTTVTETRVAKLLYVHKTPSFTHFIGVCEPFSDEAQNTLNWFREDGTHGDFIGLGNYRSLPYTDIIQVESIGNTLIVLAKNGKHYVLWKNKEDVVADDHAGNYRYLGQQPPFIQLEFCLGDTTPMEYEKPEGSTYPTESYTAHRYVVVEGISSSVRTEPVVIPEASRHDVTTAAFALINKAHDQITKEGHFYTNFLVRYCYRLYDGSMTMHSAPIFMPVSVPNSVQVGLEATNLSQLFLEYKPANAPLMFRHNNSDYGGRWFSMLSNWSDIVTSIDIFVSPQIIRVNDAERVSKSVARTNCLCAYVDTTQNEGCVDYFLNGKLQQTDGFAPYVLNLNEDSEEKYYKRFCENATFYKVKSFAVDEDLFDQLPSDFTELDLKEVLPTLTSQEAMTDSYKPHNVILPVEDSHGNVITKLYTYNSRINMSAVKEELFRGFSLEGLTIPCTVSKTVTVGQTTGNVTEVVNVKSIVWKLRTEEGDKFVMRDVNGTMGMNITTFCLGFCLYFYPDSRAEMVTVNYVRNNTEYHVDIPLEPCLSINGAVVRTPTDFWHNLFPGVSREFEKQDFFEAEVDNIVTMSNKIYTSEASNPFVFPPNSINTIGTGIILGMAANTRALSQGQFGQFPLLAFATDGVWALNVTSKGTYDSIHPISREICSNPDSICQIDQEVVFATIRGLNSVVEQNVASISAMLEGPYLPDEDIVPGLADYLQNNGYADLKDLLNWDTSPTSIFQAAQVLYDFANARLLIIGTPESGATKQNILVYSLRDQTWSSMTMPPMLVAINGYPHAYIQDITGRLTALDKRYPFDGYTGNAIPTLIVTRALSFGDAMYTINDVAHNRMMANQKTFTGSGGSVTIPRSTVMLLYGSNDLMTWKYIGRTNQRHVWYLPCRAYRYYRFAILNVMMPSEKYISTSFNVKEKFGKL